MDPSHDLASIVGQEWTSSDPGVLIGYSRDNSFVPPRMPQFVVKPGNMAELQEIVRWANRSGMPLIPVSSGAPRLRGDTVPALGGVMVDMERMNRIIRIDRKNRVAIIEAAVTFGQLVPELAKHGLRLAGPLLPRANKSVLASVLEREPTLMPRYHWDISDPLCCLEVVFGTGEGFRTGEAAGPGGLEGQWAIGGAQKFPLGPHQVDYHRIVQGAQGTMGIVTWASIKCEIAPAITKPFFLAASRLEDLIPFTYQLTKQGYGDELFIVNHVQLAAMMKGTGLQEDPEAVLSSLPPWTLAFSISGGPWYPEDQVEYLERDIKRIAQQCSQVFQQNVGNAPSTRMMALLVRPSGDPYWKYSVRGEFREIFFVTTLDRSPPYLEVVTQTAKEIGIPDTRVGVYLQPIVQGTSCHCEFDLYYDARDEQEASRAKEFFHVASSRLIRRGAFFSRPYPSWAEEVYASKSQVVASLKKVKSVFDPNHVLNPGKLCF